MDKKLGLTAIPNTLRSLQLNQTYPPTGPPGTASQITFNNDETKLLVSVKGAPPASVGFIAMWDIAADHSLAAQPVMMPPPSGGGLPFSFTPVPGQNAFVMTDPAVGALVLDLSGANKSVAVPVSGQGANCWSTFSQKTGNYYLIDVGKNKVTELSVDKNLNASIVTVRVFFPQSTSVDSCSCL